MIQDEKKRLGQANVPAENEEMPPKTW